ncbi:endothelin-converting enzyme 1-like [Ornithodoros turicata]|uniref:endothelin-converting enzyme 1-like n=1 Tax=Ornithodoros turicata TaxID=34597 RepID=UPI003138FC34
MSHRSNMANPDVMSEFEREQEPVADTKEGTSAIEQGLFIIVLYAIGALALGAGIAIIIFYRKDRPPVDRTPANYTEDNELRTRATPSPEDDEEVYERKTLCGTDDCNYMRWLISMSVDTAKNPCDNFFTYVCAGAMEHFKGVPNMLYFVTLQNMQAIEMWFKNASPPAQRQSAFQKAVKLYQSCLEDPQSSKPGIREILRNLGLSLTQELNFEPLDMQVRFLFEGHSAIYIMTPAPSRSQNDIFLDVRVSTIFDSFRSVKPGSATERRIIYQKVLHWVFEGLNLDDKVMDDVLQAEDEVYVVSSNQTYGDKRYRFGMSNIDYFAGKDRGLSERWKKSLQKWSKSLFPGRYQIQMTLNDIHLLYNLFGSKALISTKDIRTFFAWRTTWYLYNISGVTMANEKAGEIADKCLTDVLYLFKIVAPMKTLLEKVNQSTVDTVERMTNNILLGIETSFGTSNWLDGPTRKGALKKISQLHKSIGYPLGISSEKAADAYLSNVPDMTDSYVSNVVKVTEHQTSTAIDMLRSKDVLSASIMTRLIAFIPMYSANAPYNALSNVIYIPPGLMVRPIFTDGGAPALNYGALGGILTHEIMHGFDNTGKKYDGTGKRTGWFSEASNRAYANLVQCHNVSIENAPKARHYADYPAEYLADTMGRGSILKVYRKAFKKSPVSLGQLKGLTSDQLFYVAWCLMWCGEPLPDKTHPRSDERCNVPLMSSEHFGEVFNCPPESPMNPKKKCPFWRTLL